MGEAAALISALCWAATSVGMTRLSSRYGGAVLSGMRFLIASPFVIALLLATGTIEEITAAPPQVILAIVLSACIGYGIGDTVYVRALPRVGLQRMSPTATALWVAMSAAGGVLLLEEPAGWDLVFGGAAVIAGTYLVVSGQVRSVPDPHAAPRLGTAATVGVLVVVAAAWAAATLLLAGGRGDLGAVAAGAIRIPTGGLVIAAFATVATRGAASSICRRVVTSRSCWRSAWGAQQSGACCTSTPSPRRGPRARSSSTRRHR